MTATQSVTGVRKFDRVFGGSAAAAVCLPGRPFAYGVARGVVSAEAAWCQVGRGAWAKAPGCQRLWQLAFFTFLAAKVLADRLLRRGQARSGEVRRGQARSA
jgi:hypothetical protein